MNWISLAYISITTKRKKTWISRSFR
jgi:hypothetical protein